MSIKRKVTGEWREVGRRYRKVNGQWRQVTKSYRKVNGQWKLVYQRAIHQPYLVGLENFIGNYKLERRIDGTIYCEVNGHVKAGTNAKIGLAFYGLPVPANVNMVVEEYFTSNHQENDLDISTDGWSSSFFSDLANEPVNFTTSGGQMMMFINMNISYTDVSSRFTIKNLTINGVPA